MLPINGDKFLIAESIDFLEEKRIPPEHIQSQFKLKTNMPPQLDSNKVHVSCT